MADDTTGFIVEAVIILFFSAILLGFSIRQLYYDISQAEKWRPLIVCHYLVGAACILQVIGNVDPQGGLKVYSEAFSVFCGQLRFIFLLSAAQALAVGFVASHRLMTQGTKHEGKTFIFFGFHAVYIFVALVLFLVQMFTRSIAVGIVSRSVMVLYSLIVCTHTIISAIQVRKILVEENARTGKYGEGIRKLGRLIVLVAVLCIIGNSTMAVTMRSVVALSRTLTIFPDTPVDKFSGFNIFSDVAGLLALTALITGSWKVRTIDGQGGNNSKPTPPPGAPGAVPAGRKSTLKIPPSRSDHASRTDSSAVAPHTPPDSLPQAPGLKLEDLSPANSDAMPSPAGDDDDSSKKRRGKQGYEELDV